MIALVALLACTGGGAETAVPDPVADTAAQPLTLAQDVQPLLDAYCTTTCHHGSANSFSMMPGETYGEVVDVPSVQAPLLDRVEPGAPDLSYLMHKLWGTQTEVGGMGIPMPRQGEIPPEAVAAIEAWIAGGAAP